MARNRHNLFKQYIGSKKFVFRLELGLLITMKLCMLFIIKQIWFDVPLAPHMRVPLQQMQQKLLSSSSLSSGVTHDRSR